MNVFCGIDFGTTNTAVSLVNDKMSIIDSFSIPTTIFIPQESQGISKIFIGPEAKVMYFANKPGRYLHSIKRSLPDVSIDHTIINKTQVTIEEIIALFLKELRKIFFDRYQIELSRAVVGRPVYFSRDAGENDRAFERLRRGFELADIDAEFLAEPIAASLTFREHAVEPGSVMFIADIGGGTSDISIINSDIFTDPSDSHILAVNGESIGGGLFDEQIMLAKIAPLLGLGATFGSMGRVLPVPRHIYLDLCKWNRLRLISKKDLRDEINHYLYRSSNRRGILKLQRVLEENLAFTILEHIEDVKKKLEERNLLFYQRDSLVLSCDLPGSELAGIFAKPLAELERLTADTLQAVNLSPEGISRAILTGGSSRLAEIRKLYTNAFGEEKVILDSNYFMSIAIGLAYRARHLNRSVV